MDIRYKFVFVKDYYNEQGQLKVVEMFGKRKDEFNLDPSRFDYLLVLDISDPSHVLIVWEEGHK